MLHYEDTPSKALPQETPIPQRRITPQELTCALSSIEAHKAAAARRQEEEARYFASTLTIEQAIQDLALDATPDQIWQEVASQRGAAKPPLPLAPGPAPEQPAPPPTHSLWEQIAQEAAPPPQAEEFPESELPPPGAPVWRGRVMQEMQAREEQEAEAAQAARKGGTAANWVPLKALGGMAALIAAICWFASPSAPHLPPFTHPPASQTNNYNVNAQLRDATPAFYQMLKQTVGPNAPLRLVAYDTNWNQGPIRNAGALYPLNAVPDGYTFHTTSDGTPFGLRSGGEMGFLTVVAFQDAQSTALPDDALTFFRDRGALRLRGWVPEVDLPGIAHGKAFRFVSCPPPGSPLRWVPFTQPLGLHGKQTGGAYPDTQGSHGYRHVLETNYPAGPSVNAQVLLAEPTPQEPTNVPPRLRGPMRFGGMEPYYAADFDASSVLKPLSSVPDGVPIHDTLRQVRTVQAQQQPPAWARYEQIEGPIQVDVRPGLHKPWTFVKHDNHLYVRGWIAARVPQARLEGQNINVSSTPHDPMLGLTPTPITLRLDICNIGGWEDRGEGETLCVSAVHLDSHAYETWAP